MNESSRSRIMPQISLVMGRRGKDGLHLQRLRADKTGKEGPEIDGSWTIIPGASLIPNYEKVISTY